GMVEGEAWSGKGGVGEAFGEHGGGAGALWLGRGQCIEQYGAGEAYLPVLEALGRLCRGPEGPRFLALLGQHAPSWQVQMPALLGAADREALQRRGRGGRRGRARGGGGPGADIPAPPRR